MSGNVRLGVADRVQKPQRRQVAGYTLQEIRKRATQFGHILAVVKEDLRSGQFKDHIQVLERLQHREQRR